MAFSPKNEACSSGGPCDWLPTFGSAPRSSSTAAMSCSPWMTASCRMVCPSSGAGRFSRPAPSFAA